MKVTDSSTYRLMQTNLDRITYDLNSLYEQASTGLKLNKPSDDPGAIRPVLTTRTQLQHNDRYLETLGVAGDEMAATESHLDTVENILVSAEEIAISSINSGMNESDLTTLADEISALKDQLLYSANATIDGKYIFSGYKQDTAPFTKNPDYDPDLYDISDSTTWPYIYNGDHNRTELEVAPNEYMEVNLTGSELFMGISNDVAATGTTDPFLGGTQGGIDIFTVLTRLEEAIRAGNVDDINGSGGSIEAQLNNLETAAEQNRSYRSTLGLKAAQVESTVTHQENAAIDLEKTLSRYQDADVIDVFNEIAEQETAFEAALSITGRISKISILDYF